MALVVDDVLEKIGQFGLFQKRILAMFLFIFFPLTYQTLIMVFVAYEPPWMCTTNSTACFLPNSTGDELYSTSTQPIELYERRCKLNRTDWKFADRHLYEGPVDTIVTQFDLVCDKSLTAWMANAMLFFGWAIGAIVLGTVADKYGRCSVLFPSAMLVIGLSFAMAFVEAAWLVLTFRFFIGFFEGGGFLSMFVLATELVGPAKRALSGTLVWLYFSAALMILSLKAFYIRDWKTLCIVSTTPFLFILLFWKFVPESVRWLLVVGRKDKARTILEHVARVNKTQMPKEDLQVPVVQHNKGFLELFRTKRMMILTLLQCYAWFVNGMVYYGVSMSAGDFGGSIYLNFVLTSLVEIPGNLLVIDNCNRFGRKRTVVWYTVVGAIACVAVSFIPAGTNNIGFIAGRVTAGMLGKLCITVSFNGIYVFSAELFPTMVRNSGMGLLSVISRIGAALAPFVVQLTRVNAILPFALMGGLTFLAAFACWFLPETRGKPTLEVMGDEEPHILEEVVMEPMNEKPAVNANANLDIEPEERSSPGAETTNHGFERDTDVRESNENYDTASKESEKTAENEGKRHEKRAKTEQGKSLGQCAKDKEQKENNSSQTSPEDTMTEESVNQEIKENEAERTENVNFGFENENENVEDNNKGKELNTETDSVDNPDYDTAF